MATTSPGSHRREPSGKVEDQQCDWYECVYRNFNVVITILYSFAEGDFFLRRGPIWVCFQYRDYSICDQVETVTVHFGLKTIP